MPDDPRSDEQSFGSESQDELLVLAFLRGEEKALDTLLDRHQEPLWRYACKHSAYRDKSFIDDIRQIVLVTLFKKLKNEAFTPKGAGSFRAWAYKICQQITMDENRKHRRQPKHISEIYPEEFPDDLVDERTQPPSADIEETEEADKISQALDKLPKEDRQLVILAMVENKSYKEITNIKPFDKYKNRLPALRQKTCKLKRILVLLLKETK